MLLIHMNVGVISLTRKHDAVGDAFRALRSLFYEATGRRAIARVYEVLDALDLETRLGLRPIVSHKHKTAYGWHIVITLPPGISSKQIIDRLDYFKEQTGGYIDVKLIQNNVHLDIATNELPSSVQFDESLLQAQGYIKLPIGQTFSGPLIVDLSRLPHVFVAGTTGGGKTTALRTFAVSLIRQGVAVIIIDLKGLDFWHLREHAVVVSNYEDAERVLLLLNQEHDRRVHILQEAGVVKVQDLNAQLPWVAVIIDELAELQSKDAQQALNRLARLSRATGISLIAATQRPSYTLFAKFTDTRMLFSGRLCFFMLKPEDSRLILDTDAASTLPPDVPGRAIWQWDRQVLVQCYQVSIKQANAILQLSERKEVITLEQSRKGLRPR